MWVVRVCMGGQRTLFKNISLLLVVRDEIETYKCPCRERAYDP